MSIKVIPTNLNVSSTYSGYDKSVLLSNDNTQIWYSASTYGNKGGPVASSPITTYDLGQMTGEWIECRFSSPEPITKISLLTNKVDSKNMYSPKSFSVFAKNEDSETFVLLSSFNHIEVNNTSGNDFNIQTNQSYKIYRIVFTSTWVNTDDFSVYAVSISKIFLYKDGATAATTTAATTTAATTTPSPISSNMFLIVLGIIVFMIVVIIIIILLIYMKRRGRKAPPSLQTK